MVNPHRALARYLLAAQESLAGAMELLAEIDPEELRETSESWELDPLRPTPRSIPVGGGVLRGSQACRHRNREDLTTFGSAAERWRCRDCGYRHPPEEVSDAS